MLKNGDFAEKLTKDELNSSSAGLLTCSSRNRSDDGFSNAASNTYFAGMTKFDFCLTPDRQSRKSGFDAGETSFARPASSPSILSISA
jgi:hypothetical protein